MIDAVLNQRSTTIVHCKRKRKIKALWRTSTDHRRWDRDNRSPLVFSQTHKVKRQTTATLPCQKVKVCSVRRLITHNMRKDNTCFSTALFTFNCLWLNKIPTTVIQTLKLQFAGTVWTLNLDLTFGSKAGVKIVFRLQLYNSIDHRLDYSQLKIQETLNRNTCQFSCCHHRGQTPLQKITDKYKIPGFTG